MRLDKYLAETAQCTRSEAKALLAKGRVQVNGAVCKKGDTQLKDNDTVTVDGRAFLGSVRDQWMGRGSRIFAKVNSRLSQSQVNADAA